MEPAYTYRLLNCLHDLLEHALDAERDRSRWLARRSIGEEAGAEVRVHTFTRGMGGQKNGGGRRQGVNYRLDQNIGNMSPGSVFLSRPSFISPSFRRLRMLLSDHYQGRSTHSRMSRERTRLSEGA